MNQDRQIISNGITVEALPCTLEEIVVGIINDRGFFADNPHGIFPYRETILSSARCPIWKQLSLVAVSRSFGVIVTKAFQEGTSIYNYSLWGSLSGIRLTTKWQSVVIEWIDRIGTLANDTADVEKTEKVTPHALSEVAERLVATLIRMLAVGTLSSPTHVSDSILSESKAIIEFVMASMSANAGTFFSMQEVYALEEKERKLALEKGF